MKPRSLQFLPRTLVVCFAPLLVCASAHANVINTNEQSATNVWVFPTGTNVLATATPTPATPATHEGSSNSWATLTDGLLGAANATPADSVTPTDGNSVTYALDLTGHAAGYDITSFDSYCAWGDSGRDNQDFTIQYSTVANPTVFTTIATVSNHSGNPIHATHTSLTDTTGYLAMGVHSIKINFAGQENGYTGFREFILRAEPSAIVALNESSTTNVWTFPAGINLMNGGTATPAPQQPDHGGTDQASATWATVTDNSVGIASNFMTSVTPNNGNTVTFPLDTSVNFNGYNISSFDSYCAWANSGRDNQDFTIRYSTAAAPSVFIPLAEVANHTVAPLLATHTRLTPTSGFLATGVAAIQLTFHNQENGYTGYREFIALGTAVPLSPPLTWTGSEGNGIWSPAESGDPSQDNNWKLTAGGTPAYFNHLAPVLFDSTGTNTNISLPDALTSVGVTFANDNTNPYTFGGQLLTVSNDIVSSGAGSATFNNAVLATTGVTMSGAGSLVFNSDLQSPGLTLLGAGSITLNAGNSLLTGNVSVSDGTLNVGNDFAIELAALNMTGGTANFTTAAPVVVSLTGTAGTIVLGNTSSPVATNLSVGGASASLITSFAGNISQAAGDTGSFTKQGNSSLTLGGTNTYTGVTSVTGGVLEFGQRLSLYNGNTGSWTASNITVDAGATLGFKVGSAGEFIDSDLTALDMGGFQSDSTIGINATANFTLTRGITQPVALYKKGPGVLTLTGTNSYTGMTTAIAGTINAANPGGISLPGDVHLGDASTTLSLNFGAANQFGPNSVLTLANGTSVAQTRVNLRGNNQVIAGLESPANNTSIVQNDEVGQPGYTVNPGPVSLTINTTSDHIFHGIIRNMDGGALTLNENGAATQEIRNIGAGGYNYTGPTNINDGTLKINFDATKATSWSSNINIASNGATLELAGQWNIFRTITGPGKLVKSSPGQISVCNVDGDANANTFTGGTVINAGTLKFYANNGSTGEGDGPGQFCPAGPMDPSNVIQVKPGATLGVGSIACFGESPLLPQYGVTINIEPGGRLWGADGNNIAFVPNVHLDGATVEVTDGSVVGGFNTNMTFVGTVVVGGTSNVASQIFNSPGITGANANISLGSIGLPGTIFDVANVTNTSAVDLMVYSPLKDVHGVPSPLTKTGAGTMFMIGAKSYSGETHILQGELRLDTVCLADTARVSIDSGAFLNLLFAEADTVKTLKLDGVQVVAGTYGSTSNTTPGIIQTPRIKGDGMLTVTTNPAATYDTWALVIPSATDRDRTDDPDGDGFTNLQEFLFGTSPVSATASLSTLEDTGSGLIVRWNERANSDSVYVLQESTTLVNPWPTSGAAITDDLVSPPITDYVRKQALIPVNSAKKFVRVFATE